MNAQMRRDNVKGQLAKLLATENISIQHNPKASTASFDVKNRVLQLPVWENISDDLYDLLVVHEVGHALDTPSDGWVDAIADIAAKVGSSSAAVKTFLNVLEDVRIDKRQKRRYPGSRKNYAQGFKELLERDFLGLKGRDLDSFSLIDRINIYYKGGQFLKMKFTAEERAFLEEALTTETFEEVMDLTERVFAFQKGQMSKSHGKADQDEDQDDQQGGFGVSAETDEDADISDLDLDSVSGGFADEDDDLWDDKGFADTDGDDEGYDHQPEHGSRSQQPSNLEPDPHAETEENWERHQEELVKLEDVTYNYFTLPTIHLDKVVDDYKIVLKEQTDAYYRYDASWHNAVRQELNNFKKSEAQTVSFLVKEFEQKKAADEYARTSIAKTGILDTNKLFRYKYNDDVFLRHSITKEGKNHGFVLFLDWSGSMSGNIQRTIRQLISLTMFCKRVQIPFEVYLFRSARYGDSEKKMFTFKPNDIEINNFKLRNILSSRMNLSDWNTALFNLWASGIIVPNCDYRNATPLNGAIIAAEGVVKKFQSQNKVQIVSTIFLTDGDSDYLNGTISEDGSHRMWSNWKAKNFIRDEVTGKSYHIEENGPKVTDALLSILKDRTGCNLVGFFIPDRFVEAMRRYYGWDINPDYEKKLKTSWKDEGFFGVASTPYDEFYVLNPQMFDITAQKLMVDSGMSKREMVKNFTSFASKKRVSRVLLKKFIEKVVK